MSDWIDEEGYRANVGIILMNTQSHVLMGGRSGGRGWQFPQGGIRPGESVEQALYRELFEEVGLTQAAVTLVGMTEGWLKYRLPAQYRRRFSDPYVIGQRQRWCLLRLNHEDHEIRFDQSDEEPEFDSFKWTGYWEPAREVVFFKREVYRNALQELAPVALPDNHAPPDWWHRESVGRRSRQPRRRRYPTRA